MQTPDSNSRTAIIIGIVLGVSAAIVLFFSGIFPVEEYIYGAPFQNLTASVVPADVATLTNQNRIENGLSALTVSPLLTEAAQLKAEDMAENSYYAHVSPDGKTPLYWLTKVGYKYLNAGENLVIDRATSEQAVEAWMHSPDHRENILRPQFTEIGIGVAAGHYKGEDTIYVVQEFGTPYPLSTYTPPKPTQSQSITKVPKPVVNSNSENVVSPPKKSTSTPVINSDLAITSLPKTTIVTSVNTFAAPVVRALTPSKPKVDLVSTTTVATSSQSASSTPSFALAPEFFQSVTIGSGQGTSGPLQLAPYNESPKINWIGKVRALFLRITLIPRAR